MPFGEGRDYPMEESRRQEAAIVAIGAADFPEIIARPIEFVALCNNDPRPLVVKSEMTLDCGRNFNCSRGIGGRSMRDRQNHNDRRVTRYAFDRKHDHARAIFAPFSPPDFVLVVPQTGIGDNETRFRRGDRHTPRYFRLSMASRCACRLSMREAPIA